MAHCTAYQDQLKLFHNLQERMRARLRCNTSSAAHPRIAPKTTPTTNPKMRIAIIGAGISGCSQYLWLHKLGLLSNNTVTIFEARDADSDSTETYNASLIGASIGLSPTGLHVLKRLDPKLHDEILQTGHIIRSWRMSNARGWTLSLSPAGRENEIMVMIGREACCQILRKRVPEECIVRKKVVDIKLASGENGPTLIFQNNEVQEFDLVIGCDGIWSRTRRAIFGAQGRESYPYSPQYEGLVGVGGFIPSSKISDTTPSGEMNAVVGPNGFFGYGYTSSDEKTATWWSTHTLNACPDDWRTISKNDVKRQLQTRHQGWKNPAIQKIIQSDIEIESLYPTFITPLLPTWEKGGCVLVGDAAHAIQPSSGQGASMALEDCETLARFLQHYLKLDPEKGHSIAAKQYSDLRRPRLDKVFKKAQQLAGMKQDMGLFQELIMYLFIWLFALLKVMERYQRKLNEYNVPEEVAKAVGESES